MARKRLVLLGLPVVAVLTAAGVAVAASSSGVQGASAKFSTTTVSRSKVVSCSANGGDTYTATVATYKGETSSSDARLDGTLTIRARSLVDTDTKLGRLVGVFRIRSTNGNTAVGKIDATLGGSQASGLLAGRVRHPGGRLLATFSSSFDPAAGFSSGLLGQGDVTGAGVVLSGGCRAGNAHPLRWLHRHLRHLRHRAQSHTG